MTCCVWMSESARSEHVIGEKKRGGKMDERRRGRKGRRKRRGKFSPKYIGDGVRLLLYL